MAVVTSCENGEYVITKELQVVKGLVAYGLGAD